MKNLPLNLNSPVTLGEAAKEYCLHHDRLARKAGFIRDLITRQGAATPLGTIITDPHLISTYCSEQIVNGEGPTSRRNRHRSALIGFFEWASFSYQLPYLRRSTFGTHLPKTVPIAILPKATVLRCAYELISLERPYLLGLAVLQFRYGLTPAECFDVMQHFGSCYRLYGIWVPPSNGPHSRSSRIVRHRQGADQVWRRVPGFSSRAPAQKFPALRGKINFTRAQSLLHGYLQEAGWKGRVPVEVGRKCFIASVVASGETPVQIVEDAGAAFEACHAGLAPWTREEAVTFLWLPLTYPLV